MSKIELLDRTNSKEIISVNGYTVKERIGVGSYGRVYKVFKNKTYYVLKEIPLNLSNAAEKINSVTNEAQILSSLNNKYVVKFYESFKMNQNIYILMEYCDNGDLCTFLNKVKKARKDDNYYLDEDFVWKLFIQMSIGLYYIHSKKIIHRDIKTLNIFLTKNLDAKIGDLGVAKILEDTNHANTFIGTPYYVSPEMCKNKPYNEKSDIWALGCILYELLTFNHPFTANSQPALFIKILNSNFNAFPPGIPDDLKKMVEFILQKDYIKRPSMEDIITSESFQYNAARIGLEKDLKEVLKVDKLPIFNISKKMNNCQAYFSQKNNNSNTKNKINSNNNINNNKNSNVNIIKNQKSSLIIRKTGNPLSAGKKNFVKIYSNNNIFNSKKLVNKNTVYKNNSKNDCNSNSHIRLVKNTGFQETEESMSKRTKSDLNYYIETNKSNSVNKENEIKNFKKSQYTENYNNSKKYSVLNSIIINSNKNKVSPRKTKYIIKSRKKMKDFSVKNQNSQNNKKIICKSTKYYKGSKLKAQININYRKNDTSKDKIKDYKKKYIINNKEINGEIINHYSFKSKDEKNNINQENYNKNEDMINEEVFMKELNNAIKNNLSIVNLNDLLNHNFGSDDSKNLNTTSATTLLGKIESPTIATIEQKFELINKENKLSSLTKIEDEKNDIFRRSCDEFTKTEMIQKAEPFLINPIPFSNYEIKINENKKEIKHINEMSKDELMETNLIYKYKYEKYLKDLKKYSDIININEIKNMCKDINNLNDKDIKIIFDSVTNYAKKKITKR